MNRKSIKRIIVPIFAIVVVAIIGIKALTPIKAPDFEATTIDQKQIRLSQWTNKPLYIEFWSTSCSTCIDDFAQLITLQHKLSAQGGQVIAVASKTDPIEDIRALSTSLLANNILIVHDHNGSIAKAFGHSGITPFGFLINQKGNLAKIHAGRLNIANIMSSLTDQH